MDLEIYLLFVGSCVLFGMLPGPNVALIVANSIAYGSRYGLISVAGAVSAMAVQLTATTLGAATLLILMSFAFEWIRWIGVAYLLYLGFKHWFSKENNSIAFNADKKTKSYKKVYWQGFLVAVTNPKTLLFLGAFLPQFVSYQGNILAQMVLLSVTFIIVLMIVDSCWAILAGKVHNFMPSFIRLRQRISGAFFVIAGIGLVFARKP